MAIGKKESILRAARDMLVQYGYKKTTVEDVARHAGLERASVYYYFKNKEEMFEELVQQEAEAQGAVFFAAQDKETTACGKLLAIAKAHIQIESSELLSIARQNPPNVSQMLPQAMEVMERRSSKTLDLIKNILISGVNSGELKELDPQAIAVGIQTPLWGHVVTLLLSEPNPDLTTAVSAVVEAIVSGLVAHPQ